MPEPHRWLPELCKVVLDALTTGAPLVAATRAEGFTGERLKEIEEVEFLKTHRRQFANAPDLAAGRDAFLEGVGRLKRLPPLYYLIRELRKEMEAGIARSTAVVMAQSEPDDGATRQVVRVRRPREMKLKGARLALDGTASPGVWRAL